MCFVKGKIFLFEICCIDNYFGLNTSDFISLDEICYSTVFGRHNYVFFQLICITIDRCHNFLGIFKTLQSGCQVRKLSSSRTSLYEFFFVLFYIVQRMQNIGLGMYLRTSGNSTYQPSNNQFRVIAARALYSRDRFAVFYNAATRPCFTIFAISWLLCIVQVDIFT